MLKSALGKVMWVGRATVFLVGLAVMLALVFGVVSIAAAHSGSAGLFHLNHNNPVTALSKLTGNLSGAVLKVDNNGAGPALALQVEPGKQPMTVNSDGKVARLNADKLDGQNSSAFVVTGNGKQGDFVNIDSCGSGPVLSYPLTLTRSARIFASASSGYGRSAPGPERPSIRIQLLDSSNTVVAQSGRVITSESGNPTLNIGEVLLNDAGNAAYDAPAGNYTLRIFADNFGTCAGFGQYQSPRLTHIVLAEGQ